MTHDELKKYIFQFLKDSRPGRKFLIIGTDSTATSEKETVENTKFVSVIVLRREGYGAFYFWCGRDHVPVYGRDDRLRLEGRYSTELAIYLEEILEEILETEPGVILPEFEVHLDISEQGKSRKIAKNLIGTIVAQGYMCFAKPNSYAASTVADHHC